jgi:UDP-N-acetylmuramoylalanine-D-glutamate ligase
VPGADDRGDRDEGQDHDLVADRGVLARRPAHPVVLGGNIGTPIVERLLELTPAHRVVDELSELQLPTLSRGTTVAVYTNVTSDHLDRHGTLEAYRRSSAGSPSWSTRRALVLNVEDPVVATYRRCAAAGDPLPRDAPTGRARRRRRLDRGDGSAARAGGGDAATVRPIMPSRAAIPAPTTSRTRWPRSPSRSPSGRAAAIRRAAAAFTGVEHRLETGARHRWRPVRQRLAGHPARRGRSPRSAPSSRRSC